VKRLSIALQFGAALVLLLGGAFLLTSSGMHDEPLPWQIAGGLVCTVALVLLGYGVVRLNRNMSDYN
jgi:hypothetical protein